MEVDALASASPPWWQDLCGVFEFIHHQHPWREYRQERIDCLSKMRPLKHRRQEICVLMCDFRLSTWLIVRFHEQTVQISGPTSPRGQVDTPADEA
jgi:hypothetical protein